MSLLSVDEARTRILTHFQPIGAETLPLAKCARRVLAVEIRANHDLPSFDNSSMDGFAVIAADLVEAAPASPRALDVVADIPAGTHPEATLLPGQAESAGEPCRASRIRRTRELPARRSPRTGWGVVCPPGGTPGFRQPALDCPGKRFTNHPGWGKIARCRYGNRCLAAVIEVFNG